MVRTKQYFNEWRDHALFNSEGTKKKYILVLKPFVANYEADLKGVQDYITNDLESKSKTTKNVFISAVKHFIEYVRKTHNYTFFNVADLKLFKSSTISENEPLPEEYVLKIFDLVETEKLSHLEKFIVIALITTGVRSEQLYNRGNNWNKLKDNNFMIIDAKGSKERKIFSNKYLSALLPINEKINYDKISKATKKVKKLIGYKGMLTPHTFRYTYATRIFNKGGWKTTPYLQKLLGHASIDQTLAYIALSAEDIEATNNIQFMTELEAIKNMSKDQQIDALKAELNKKDLIIEKLMKGGKYE